MQLDIGGLTKSTNYTIKLFARNYVFEGNAAQRKIQTKYVGMKICTKNALRVHKNGSQTVDYLNIHLISIQVTSTKHTMNPSACKLNIALYMKLGMVSSTFKFIAVHTLVVVYIKWVSLNLELNKNLS